MMTAMNTLLQLMPEYHARVWGGDRLRAGDEPIGEAWIVYEHNRIAGGRLAGRTLADAAAEMGANLLGEAVVAQTGNRFPLLIKLLDCRDWLSVQVHPNDEQARQLEGPDQFGKTEAWHILEADEGARVIAGVKPGATPEAIAEAIRNGTILDWAQYHPVHAGDTVYMPAGTLHALGPGLLIYEVQQTSDITYRVFDWNRPATSGRALHIDKSLTVTNAAATGDIKHLPAALRTETQLVASPYFMLDLLMSESEPLAVDTRNESFHALTVIDGAANVVAGREQVTLRRFETVIVPAATGAYQLQPHGATRVLKAGVEPGATTTD